MYITNILIYANSKTYKDPLSRGLIQLIEKRITKLGFGKSEYFRAAFSSLKSIDSFSVVVVVTTKPMMNDVHENHVLKLNDRWYMNWKELAFRFIKIIQYGHIEIEYMSTLSFIYDNLIKYVARSTWSKIFWQITLVKILF